MFYKYLLYALFLSILFSGCSSSNQNALKSSAKPISKSKYVSQSGYYYVLIEKEKNGWKIVDIQVDAIEKRANENQEILKINESYSEIEPNFEKTNFNYNLSKFSCNNFNSTKNYTPCTSNFSSSVNEDVFGFLRLNSSSLKYKFIDERLIDEAIKQTNLFIAIENKKIILERKQCEQMFYGAKSVDEFDAFIEKYSSFYYASTLIPLAIKNRDNLKIQEQNKKIEEEIRLARESELKIQEEKRLDKINEIKTQETFALSKIEDKTRQNHKKRVEEFRKTLKSGVDTNCGPVLEKKDSLVKVYFPVKNYGNEHWIDANKLFPKNHGCCFVKGKYIAPPTF